MQERFIKFKDPITSIGANAKTSGMIAGSRYRGFDKIINPVGLNFEISHETTGEVYPIPGASAGLLNPSTPKGVWATKQGVTIKDDAPIPLTLETNNGNNSQRIDYLVGKHYHDTVVAGGVAATYSIIKGPVDSALEPTITVDPLQTVILGKFYIPANATSMTGVIYIPERARSLGGTLPMLIDEANRATDQQQDNQASNVTVISQDYELTARGVILALDKGNTFKAEIGNAILDLLPNKPNGTEINIHFTTPIKLRSSITQIVDPVNGNSTRAGYSVGLRGLLLSSTLGLEIDVMAHQIVKFVKVDVGGAYNNTAPNQNYIWGELWKVVNISDSPEKIKNLETKTTQQSTDITTLQGQVASLTTLINNINPPRSYKWIDYQGTLTDDFDAQGKAKSTSAYYGYHICNGNGGTPDMRGRFMVGLDGAQTEFSSVGFVGGLKRVLLTIANLVSFRIGINVRTSNSDRWNTSSGSGRPVTNVGGVGNGSDNQYQAYTDYIGGGQDHENLPPYRVGLPLMWIGVAP